MTTRRFYRRRFLNRRGFHAGAYVLADCKIKSTGERDDAIDLQADLTIADCSRIATIDLCAYDKDEARNVLHKIRLLRTIVDDLADVVEDGIHEAYPDLT